MNYTRVYRHPGLLIYFGKDNKEAINLIKSSVKKPYLTVVAVIVILVLGFVSLSKMKTDLLPNMSMPYLMIITTEPGASPQKVEEDVTRPIESAVGTLSGVKNIISNSAENYSLVMLEYESGTNMDSAMVKISSALNMLSLPEMCGTPNVLEISMDMMATVYATVSYEGKDIINLTEFADDTVVPYFERKEGIANITEIGAVTQSMEIRLDEDKIEALNDKILEYTNDKLADAGKDITKAKDKLNDAQSQLDKSESTLANQQNDTNAQLTEALSKLDDAKAAKAAYEATLQSLNAQKAALEAEKKAYEDNKINDTYQMLDGMLKGLSGTLSQSANAAGKKVISGIEEAVSDKAGFEAYINWIKSIGYGEQVKTLTYDSLKSVYDIVNVRIPQIDTELANLAVKIKASEAINNQLAEQMKDLDKNYKDALSGALSATSGFGQAGAQISSGKTGIDDAKKELDTAEKTLKKSKKAARENANLDMLLSLDALSGLIYAQNFEMPAGYIDDKEDNQWLLKVGEEYDSKEAVEDMVLCKVPGIGKVKVSDVADITIIDDSKDSYARYNGDAAIILAIYKASTANTSDVSKNCKEAIEELETKYQGLKIVPFNDQSDYISMFLESVLYSMLIGAILAIIVLVLFLKSVRPTIVVAFSIPFSILFAIILMYFSGININVMSLAGLGLAIGMLVDNSIVVIENIFRLRNKGVEPARAAVWGTKQVASAIISSTLTTIFVFIPMIFTSGMIKDLVIPFALTITYALTASLIVALTLVPTFGSVMLKKIKPKKQPFLEKVLSIYGKILSWCLRFKVVPLLVAGALLVFSIVGVFRMGIVMMPDMSAETFSVTLNMPEDTPNDKAVEIADEALSNILSVEAVKDVAVMDNVGMANMLVGGIAQGGESSFDSIMMYITPEEYVNTVKEFDEFTENIKEVTKDTPCEVIVGMEESMSSIMSTGISVNIYGEDDEILNDIGKDIMGILESTEGITNVSDGAEDNEPALHLTIDKDKAAKCGLTVAQIYSEITAKLTTEKKATQVVVNNHRIDVNIVDETDVLTYENLMDLELSVTKKDEQGNEKVKKYKLSDFAVTEQTESAPVITRENQSKYITVTSEMEEGYNAALIARDLKPVIEDYEAPEGYSVVVAGESEEVVEMLEQMLLALLLGFLLIYLVMVAQFQSLLSPFIVIFTIPLAFTGGFLGLLIAGEEISALSLMGFMVLMGTVVNNGIVFVDYVNQLRIQGLDKKNALLATGKTRFRPIFMTAFTTVLAMSNMAFSNDAGSVMSKGMAIVIFGGLLYSTIMTLIIVPVMYDILYRRTPKVIDVGEDIDEEYNEARDYIESNKEV